MVRFFWSAIDRTGFVTRAAWCTRRRRRCGD